MISFESNYDLFDIQDKSEIRSWILEVIKNENKIPGELHYVFLSDESLLEINKQYLNHFDYTDIITFPLSETEGIIRGEIYISIDRVKENALQNGIDFENELTRVLVHGVLHLLGYEDHSEEEKQEMRSKEDYYLNLLSR